MLNAEFSTPDSAGGSPFQWLSDKEAGGRWEFFPRITRAQVVNPTSRVQLAIRSLFRLCGSPSRGYNRSMKEVTVEQATGALGDLVDAAISGEDVVLVHNGHGAVRLVPVPPSEGRPQFGSAKGMITMSDDFDAPLEDFREYME
jgi:antitoxin (DNA-binding transcriptional repressor) of toxin-antitoxin stability system